MLLKSEKDEKSVELERESVTRSCGERYANRAFSRCILFFYIYLNCPSELILEFKFFCVLYMLTRLGRQISIVTKEKQKEEKGLLHVPLFTWFD